MIEQEKEILSIFEQEHSSGATSAEIIAVLSSIGIRLSEPTLRKYVQLGLVPRSRRVGAKGRHQGSWGVYPAWSARQIYEIKKLLADGMSIQNIAEGEIAIFSKCREVTNLLREISSLLEKVSKRRDVDSSRVIKMKTMISQACDLVENTAEQIVSNKKVMEIAI